MPIIAPSGTLGSHFSDLPKRLASAALMICLALWTLFEGDWIFDIFWCVCGVLIHWEWQRMVSQEGVKHRVLIGTLSLSVAALLVRFHLVDLSLLSLISGAGVLAALAPRGQRLWQGSGVLYAGALIIAVFVLRHSILDGFESIVWLFALVWGTDVMAYIGGRIIGGPKLWPRVSPSKTWSGFITGITSGAILGVVVLLLLSSSTLSITSVFLLGLCTCAVAQGGDLFESSLKRHFGIKDSSHLIPGHGGFMDRLDGFLTAAVFAALVGSLIAGVAAAAHGIVAW